MLTDASASETPFRRHLAPTPSLSQQRCLNLNPDKADREQDGGGGNRAFVPLHLMPKPETLTKQIVYKTMGAAIVHLYHFI